MSCLESTPFCNDGSAPLRVPGFGSDLRFRLPPVARFSSPFDNWWTPYLKTRELAVLRTIDVVTDTPDWADAVLRNDERQIASWEAQARSGSELIDSSAWDWVMLEVRDKAVENIRTAHVLVFNSGANEFYLDPDTREPIEDCAALGFGVCKSDALVSDPIIKELLQHTACFFQSRHASPGLGYQVDPSMFPLIFNRTPVLHQAGQTVPNVTESGDGVRLTGHGHAKPADEAADQPVASRGYDSRGNRSWDGYSTVHQWPPCEVDICGAREEKKFRIASYINNLDSARFEDLYKSIERVISSLIDPWNEVLVKAGFGRTPLRIHTFGVDYSPGRLYRTEPWVNA